MLQQQIRTNWVSQNDTNRWRSLQMCGKWKFHDLTYTADAIMSLCYFEFVNPKWYKNKTLKIAGYFLQKTESETSCNISGPNHFVLICCCNISSQIRFVLNCCCNISGQTERPEKTCYFWEEFHVFCTFQLILVLLMHIEYHFCKKNQSDWAFLAKEPAFVKFCHI